MKANVVERWIWILIYGGMLASALGLFVASTDDELAGALIAGGIVVALAGVVLIVVRSRMKP